MNVRPNLQKKSVGSDNPQVKQDSCKPLEVLGEGEGEESLIIWESTQKEFQCLEKKQKASWLKNMSSLKDEPEVTSNSVAGNIGHYGKFSFGEEVESSGGGCSEDESSGEEEPKLFNKRKHLEGHSSDDSSDGEIFPMTKKRKIVEDGTIDELLLPDSDSSVEENDDNKSKHQDVPSGQIQEKKVTAKETSQTDSLCLEDEDSDERDWDIPEELRVKPAEEYQSDSASDDELEHNRATKPDNNSVTEKEKLLIRLRWKKGKRTMEKQIIVMAETKFKQIKQMVVKNFKLQLKMMFDGELVKDTDTAKSLGLEITLDNENADMIDCVLLYDQSKS